MEKFQDLSRFENTSFKRGRPKWVEVIWRCVSFFIFEPRLVHGYALKRFLLRVFGAKIGERALLKPRIYITFPWKLTVGDDCWIGEGVWIDNLAAVRIEDHSVISQGVYVCTGNHNYQLPSFDLITKEVHIGSQCWIGAKAMVGPGVTLASGTVITMGSVITKSVTQEGQVISQHNQRVKARVA